MRIVLLAPIDSSLYARCLLHLLKERFDVVGVIVNNPFRLKRFRSEIKRDGAALVRKIYEKLVCREKSELSCDSLSKLAQRLEISSLKLNHLCREMKIPYLKIDQYNDSCDFAHQLKPDLFVFTGGGILRKSFLEVPKLGTLNCHMGLLPKYRGMDVVEWPFVDGDRKTGITVHYMDAGLDTGDILLTESIPLENGETFLTARKRFGPKMVYAMLRTIEGLDRKSIFPKPQSIASGIQYFVMHKNIRDIAANRII